MYTNIYSSRANYLIRTPAKAGGRIGYTYEWADKAGGYAIQGTFARYVKRIDGDFYNVMGLPISRIYQILKDDEII